MTPLEIKALRHIESILNKVDPPHPTAGLILTGEGLEQWKKRAEVQWLETSKQLREAVQWLETLFEEAKK